MCGVTGIQTDDWASTGWTPYSPSLPSVRGHHCGDNAGQSKVAKYLWNQNPTAIIVISEILTGSKPQNNPHAQ